MTPAAMLARRRQAHETPTRKRPCVEEAVQVSDDEGSSLLITAAGRPTPPGLGLPKPKSPGLFGPHSKRRSNKFDVNKPATVYEEKAYHKRLATYTIKYKIQTFSWWWGRAGEITQKSPELTSQYSATINNKFCNFVFLHDTHSIGYLIIYLSLSGEPFTFAHSPPISCTTMYYSYQSVICPVC